MKKLIVATVLAGVSFGAFAEPVYVWTGAVDGKWMEPGNWTVKGSDPAVSPSVEDLQRDDTTVEFTEVTGGHTTIDLEGLDVISNLIVRAGSPKYTFGTCATQVFSLVSHYNTDIEGGRFTIEAGAATPDIPCRFGLRRDCSTDGWNVAPANYLRYPTITHDAADPLVFTNAVWWGTKSDFPWQFAIGGSGTVRFEGYSDVAKKAAQFVLLSTTGGRLVWSMPGSATLEQIGMPATSAKADGVPVKAVLEIDEGTTMKLNDGFSVLNIGTGAKLRIEGEGTYRYPAGEKSDSKKPAHLLCDNFDLIAGEVEFAVNRVSQHIVKASAVPPDYYGNFCWSSSGGTVTFCEPSSVSGAVKVVSSTAGAKLRLPSIGFGKETPTSIGYADLHVAGDGIIDYIGAGETCDRSLTITNRFAGQTNGDWATRDPKAQIWHDGTGKLVWQGPIDAHVNAGQAATLTLGGTSASDAEFDVALGDPANSTLALNKVGAGLWRITKNCTFTGATTVSAGTLALADGITYGSSVSLKAGTLQVEGDLTLASVVQTSGSSILRVIGETTLTITKLSYSKGSLTIIADDAATVKVENQKGESPTWLKWKNVAAAVGADGTVAPGGVTGIAARGDVVTDDVGTVAVVKVGSGENTKLAATDVSIGALQQLIRTPATIALGEGETLTAGALGVAANSGDLTVGAVAGRGTVTGASKLLSLTSESPDATVTVKAALGSATNLLTAGTATLAGGTAMTADLRVSKGVLKLTGEQTFKFDSISVGRGDQNAATIILDGAKDVQFGDGGFLLGLKDAGGNEGSVPVRMVITNSTLTSYRGEHTWATYNDDFGTFVIGRRRNAILEVQAGSLISNILCVSPMPVDGNKNIDRWYTGLLRQTGGEVRPASGRSNCGIGGRYGAATYLMEGGLLQPVSAFHIGNYAEGTLDLRGGTVTYPSGISIGHCNGAHGLLRASGGTMTVGVDVTLSTASQGGRGYMLLEDEASVTARSVNTTIPSANFTCWAVVALNGGVLEVLGFNQSKASTETQKAFMDVGFSGGTLRLKGTSIDIFHYAPNGGGNGTPRATVYAGGCTVDTNGKSGNFSTEPFAGPTGKGVAGVTMPKKSYTALCEPFIEITGDGYGALAVPIWDYETLTFSGVRIVQPGYGYTWAKVKAIKVNNSSFFEEIDCELADNVNTGSFTKAGEGDFTFKAVNTYGGDTVLKGGTLTANVEGAIPSGSTVVFAGGTLTLGEGIPAPTRYAADYAAALQGTPTAGGYVFPDGATITVRNVPAGDLPARVDLLSLDAGYAGPKPAIDLTGITLPKDYEVRWVGRKLRLGPPTGTLLIIR